MGLLNLPNELLVLILEELGGRELRRGVGADTNRLTICRRWYAAALPVFLSGLDVIDLQATGSTIEKLSSLLESDESRRLMHRNTRTLNLRLHGCWWDSRLTSTEAMHTYVTRDPLGPDDDPKPPPGFLGFNGLGFGKSGEVVEHWQDVTLQESSLIPLFTNLTTFSVLESVRFEVFQGSQEEFAPQWDWLQERTWKALLKNVSLSVNLTSLTLDTPGSTCGNDVEFNPQFHICHSLGVVIPRIKHVRLRLAKICAWIFTREPEVFREARLEILAIKLYVPYHPWQTFSTASGCGTLGLAGPETVRRVMIETGAIFAKATIAAQTRRSPHEHSPRLKKLCISYMEDGHWPGTAPELTVDCVSMRSMIYRGRERFSYDDQGWPRWVEDDDDLMRVGEEYVIIQPKQGCR